MKRVLSLFFCLSVAVVSVYAIDLGGNSYYIDTLESFSVGPGTDYLSLRMRRTSDNQGRLDVHVMRVDTRDPYVSIESELGGNKVVGTERPSVMAQRISSPTHIAFAGTNGDFFVTQGDVGCPVGLAIENDEYAFIGSTNRRVGGVKQNGKPIVAANWKYTGRLYTANNSDTLVIKHVNYTRKENELVLYNRHNGATTGTNQYGTEMLVQLCAGETWKTNGRMRVVVLSKERNVGSMAIPEGAAVLSAHGTMQQAVDSMIHIGDTLTVRFTLKLDGVNTALSQCVGGDNYALIVDSGRVEQSNYWNELHPRTGYGVSVTGDTALFCVVDGRGQSVGCNTNVLGEIMQHYGAWRAVNWDGGGSSSMYVRHFGNQVNHGSDGSERAVANAMFAVANLPEEDNVIADVRAYNPTLRLPRHGMVTPKFLAYNKYGVLLDTDLQGVTLSCDSEVGTVLSDTTFVCNNGGELQLHYGQITNTIYVQLSSNADLSLRLKSVVVSDDSDYPIEVLGTVGNNRITLLPSAVSWTVEDETIATVSDGLLNGLSNGRTRLFAELGSYHDTLEVVVEIPESKPLLWDDMVAFDTRMDMYPSAEWQTTFTANENGKSVLSIDYQNAGRQPIIDFAGDRMLYSTPKYIELRYQPTDFPIENISFGLRANNAVEEVTTDPIAFVRDMPQEAEQDGQAGQIGSPAYMSVVVNMDSLFGVNRDFGVFPIHFTYMSLGLTNQATKQQHKIVFDGLYLHYSESTLHADRGDAIEYTSPADRRVVKTIYNGQIVIIRGDAYFNTLGIRIQ